MYLISVIWIFNDSAKKHWVTTAFQGGEVKLFDSHFGRRISSCVELRLLRCMAHWLTPMDCWSLLLLYSSSHHVAKGDNLAEITLILMKVNSVNTW